MKERDQLFIGLDAFSTLLFSAVETYPEESSGILFGEEDPDPENVRFDVWSVIPHQKVEERGKDYVDEDLKSYLRLVACQKKITGGVLLGGFHSHPDSNPIISDFNKEYVRGKKTHRLEIILGLKLSEKEGPEWGYFNDDLSIQGSFPIGDSIYTVNMTAYQLKGNRFFRLALISSYVEILHELAEFGSLNFHTLGDIFERARNLRKDVYKLQNFIKDLEDVIMTDSTFKERRSIIRRIKDYLD